jgi:hypothetical protein
MFGNGAMTAMEMEAERRREVLAGSMREARGVGRRDRSGSNEAGARHLSSVGDGAASASSSRPAALVGQRG